MSTPASQPQSASARDPNGEEAQRLISRNEAAKTERQTTAILWDDCARYIMQRKGNILTKLSPGQAQTTNIYDTTATEAALVCAAGILTHIMPAGEKWFRLSPRGQNAPAAAREWLDKLGDAAIEQIYTSNFYRGMHEDLLDDVVFGTSLLLLEEGKKRLLNYINIPVGTFSIEENSEGDVDTIYREWQWTARQAKQEWGEEALGPLVRQALRDKTATSSNKKFTFIHIIEPRDVPDYKQGELAAPDRRPIRSVYVCKEDKRIIDDGGYYEMPAFCSRFERSNNEVYGRSPGTQAMPEIKLVNAMERDMLTAIELNVRPPWLIPNESDTDAIENVPDGISYYDSTANGAKPEPVVLKNRLDLGEMKTEQKRQRIRDAFFNKMFQMLSSASELKREKTAYEVQMLVAEQLVLFSPIFSRFIEEKTNPMIERVVGIVLRSGLVEPPPPEIQGIKYEITYTSKIALAIKAAENQSIVTMMTLVQQAAAVDPSAADLLKWPESLRMMARNIGVPASVLRTEAEQKAMSAQRAKMEQAAQAAEVAKTAAQGAQALGPKAQEMATETLARGRM
jgi:hypothetical protein